MLTDTLCFTRGFAEGCSVYIKIICPHIRVILADIYPYVCDIDTRASQWNVLSPVSVIWRCYFLRHLASQWCWTSSTPVVRRYPPWPGQCLNMHDDVIKWKHFPRYWPFLRGIHWSPVNYQHKQMPSRSLLHYNVNVKDFYEMKTSKLAWIST